ncbi:MAG: inosine/xanthosine triphosphatase [Candidatus Cyclobacteriaceae bacterium M2_1C_046]
MKKVIIASKNPVKINAAKIAFEKMLSGEEFSFEGVSVPSGVQDQPMTNAETLEGAGNRASNAKKKFPDADFWIGIEGGIDRAGSEMEAFAWVVIKSENLEGKARTATFFLPKKVIQLINEGKELGEADDIVFGHSNSKQKNGAVGLLTDNVIDRTHYYSEAVVLALIPFKNLNLY